MEHNGGKNRRQSGLWSCLVLSFFVMWMKATPCADEWSSVCVPGGSITQQRLQCVDAPADGRKKMRRIWVFRCERWSGASRRWSPPPSGSSGYLTPKLAWLPRPTFAVASSLPAFWQRSAVSKLMKPLRLPDRQQSPFGSGTQEIKKKKVLSVPSSWDAASVLTWQTPYWVTSQWLRPLLCVVSVSSCKWMHSLLSLAFAASLICCCGTKYMKKYVCSQQQHHSTGVWNFASEGHGILDVIVCFWWCVLACKLGTYLTSVLWCRLSRSEENVLAYSSTCNLSLQDECKSAAHVVNFVLMKKKKKNGSI